MISDSVVHSVERLLRFLLGILYINSPLLCKVQVHIFCTHNVTVSFSVSITSEFCWTISVQNKVVVSGIWPLLSSIEPSVNSVSKLRVILEM